MAPLSRPVLPGLEDSNPSAEQSMSWVTHFLLSWPVRLFGPHLIVNLSFSLVGFCLLSICLLFSPVQHCPCLISSPVRRLFIPHHIWVLRSQHLSSLLISSTSSHFPSCLILSSSHPEFPVVFSCLLITSNLVVEPRLSSSYDFPFKPCLVSPRLFLSHVDFSVLSSGSPPLINYPSHLSVSCWCPLSSLSQLIRSQLVVLSCPALKHDAFKISHIILCFMKCLCNLDFKATIRTHMTEQWWRRLRRNQWRL